MADLERVYVERFTRGGLCPSRAPDLKTCDSLCEGQRKIRCMWKIHIVSRKWKIMFEEKLPVLYDESPARLLRNVFRSFKVCYVAGVQY
jgi:hypothetical protein